MGQVQNNDLKKLQSLFKKYKNTLANYPGIFKKLSEAKVEAQEVGLSFEDVFDLPEFKKMDPALLNEVKTFVSESEEPLNLKTFELLDGTQAEFSLMKFTPEMLENDVSVDLGINGREQEFLNKDSLSDIAETLKKGQLLPCFATPSESEEGKYEWLDGSRRRVVAIQEGLSLEVYVSLFPIDPVNSEYIADQIQSSHKEHSLRERGFKYQSKIDAGLEVPVLLNAFKVSKTTFDKALRAARIPASFLREFIVDLNAITHDEWVSLAVIHEKSLPERKESLEDFIERMKSCEELKEIQAGEGTAFEIQKQVIQHLKVQASKKPKAKAKPKAKKIVQYNKYTHIKPSVDNDNLNLNFGRVNQAVREELLAAVKGVMDKHYAE